MHPVPLLSASLLFSALSAPGHGPVEWVHTLADAQARANTEQKPILVYCWGDGSEFCGKLYSETLNAAEVGEPLGQFVCYSAKHGGPGAAEVFEKFGVRTLPTMVFLTSAGVADDLIQGFIPPADFVGELARIRRGEGTVGGLRRQMDEAADGSTEDIEARYALAGKVQGLGDEATHDELMASIKQLDPSSKTLIGARLHMGDIVKAIVGEDGDGEYSEEAQKAKAAKWDLAPLYAHVKTAALPAAKHEAWQKIGNMEVARSDMQAAFTAFRSAWKTCPDDKVVDWSNDIARWIVKNATDRTSKEKKFALELAQSALEKLQAQLKKSPPTGDEKEMYANYTAYCWNTVAWCQHINGKKSDAVKAATRCLELRETDEYRADLAKFGEG